MTQGVVLFAFNNEAFDYQRLAAWSAQRINRHLDLPVTLITDQTPESHGFDQVILIDNATSGTRYFTDIQQNVAWHNHSRPQAFEVSPYDQTLVLDVDYVVCCDHLSHLFNSSQEFLCHRRAHDVTGLTDYSGLNYFGRNRMPMSWATAMYFKKTLWTEQIFSMMSMVRNHWPHYRDLYGISGRNTYRNDHALSIAISAMHGHVVDYPGIPWDLASLDPHHNISQIDQDKFKITFRTAEGQSRHFVWSGNDIHVMGKKNLGEIIGHNC